MVLENRLLRVRWTARILNQSIVKEISPEYSLEGLMLKLKLQNLGHLMQTTDTLENILMLGKMESRKRRGWQRIRRCNGFTDSMDMSLSKLRELVMNREARRAAVHDVSKTRKWLSNWTLQMAPPYGRKWRGIKEPVDESERRKEKVGLKLNTQKTEIMSSGPITSRQIDGGKWKQWWNSFSWPPKSPWTLTTATKLKTLSPWKKSNVKPQEHIKKQR